MAGPEDEAVELDQGSELAAELNQVPEGDEPEAEPAAEPAAEQAAPAAAAPAETQHHVPLSVLIEERREFQARMAEMNEKLLAAGKPAVAADQPEKPEEVDFLEDPKAYIDSKAEQVRKALEKLESTANETRTQAEARQQQEQFFGALGQDEAAFVAKQADYLDAVTFQRDVLRAQILARYPEAQEQQILQTINQAEIQLAAEALRAGRSAAETAYKVALAGGYRPKAADPGKPGLPPAPPAPAGKAPVANLDAARRAAAATTLGGGGGAADLDADIDGDVDPIDQALQERFQRR